MTVEKSAPSRARVQAKLLALRSEDLAPPYVDPRVAALVALGVLDFVRSPEGHARFAELEALDGFDRGTLEELDVLAEMLMRAVDAFDVAPREAVAVTIPEELDVRCRAQRSALVSLLEPASDRAGVSAALARVKLAYGPVDLANDLRALAALVERHALDAQAPTRARVLARELESLLIAHDTAELAEARRTLRRVWAVFEASYRGLAEVGRELFSDDPEAMFPTLDAIAAVERTARSSSSSRAPASLIVERSLPASRRTGMSSRRMRAVRAAMAGADPVKLEAMLHAHSESNLWLGFSQDIAEGGVFVATYHAHALGTPAEIVVHFPDREDALQLTGVVHWQRPASAGDELPAGVGVRLTQLSAEAARALEAFAVRRTPIFYDD